MMKNDLDEKRMYQDGVGVMRCGTCLRPLQDHAGDLLVTMRARDLSDVLAALTTATHLARRLIDNFETDLAQ